MSVKGPKKNNLFRIQPFYKRLEKKEPPKLCSGWNIMSDFFSEIWFFARMNLGFRLLFKDFCSSPIPLSFSPASSMAQKIKCSPLSTASSFCIMPVVWKQRITRAGCFVNTNCFSIFNSNFSSFINFYTSTRKLIFLWSTKKLTCLFAKYSDSIAVSLRKAKYSSHFQIAVTSLWTVNLGKKYNCFPQKTIFFNAQNTHLYWNKLYLSYVVTTQKLASQIEN